MNEPKNEFGVAFSGGGYRATTYHIGTINALHDLGALKKVNVIATNSGGSITGAYYALHAQSKTTSEIVEGLQKGLKGNVITSALFHPRILIGLVILLLLLIGVICFPFVCMPWWSLACLVALILLILKFQFELVPLSMGIRKAYDKFFFHGKTLTDIVDSPILVMNATNVETGKLWSFSKNKMDDYTYRYEMNPPVLFKTDRFPLSRAVNASSCVPFAFTPVRIPHQFFVNSGDTNRVHPYLIDGGIYDNQGIHKLIQQGSSFECKTVLVSDAGAGTGWQSNQSNVLSLLIRVTDIFMLRTKNMQMIAGVFDNTENRFRQREIGYFSLGMNANETVPFFIQMFKKGQLTPSVVVAQKLTGREKDPDDVLINLVKDNIQWAALSKLIPSDQEWKIACAVSTNLTPLSKAQSDALIKHAYVMTFIFMRLYCPSMLK